MSWLNEFANRVQQDVPLAPLTWFRLGGPAKALFRPHNVDELATFSARARMAGLAVRVLGLGANVLIRDDGFDGVVVRLDAPEFQSCVCDGEVVIVGAGANVMHLSKELSRRGLAGLEGMAGIPATVGGAVRMNAGGRFGDFGDVVVDATVLRADGSVETWDKEQLAFGYRRSAIRTETVLSARLQLRHDDPAATRARFDACLSAKQESQPLADHSAGCIFKNPTVAPAGALIDRAGLKGMTCGRARISERHANFIVADRGACTSDVLGLIEQVQQRVWKLFGTRLETEIDVW